MVPLIACGLFLMPGQGAAQEEEPAGRFYAALNQARLDEGLPPYGWSDLLAASAQRHADDLAATGSASHIGSDGSSPAQRIAKAGYVAWGEGEVIGEVFWIGYGGPEAALEWFLADPEHRETILSSRFREVGIGVATGAEGQTCFVLDFGARPNVLPIFINDGAATTESPQVAIRLTNEEAYPQGQGTTFMGRAIEVRISNTPDFDDLPWQPWEPLAAWTLPETPGEHIVYVQFRDGAGRTAASADAIQLLVGEESPTPTPPIETPVPTPTPPHPTPTISPPPSPSPQPPTPSPSPFIPSPPPASPTSSLSYHPLPTWTPLPALIEERPGRGVQPSSVLCALQAVALLLGGYLALRRSRS